MSCSAGASSVRRRGTTSEPPSKRQKTRAREERLREERLSEERLKDVQVWNERWFGRLECERAAAEMQQRSSSLWGLPRPTQLSALWSTAELALFDLGDFIAKLSPKEQIARALSYTSSLVFVMQAMPAESGADGLRDLWGVFVTKMVTSRYDATPALSFAEDPATLSCVVASLQFTVQSALLYGRAERWGTLGGLYPATRCFMNYVLRDLTERVAAQEYAASALMKQVIEELARVLGRDVATS